MTNRLVCALDNIVGPGSQHEHTCDKAEHDDDSACVWCEARAALAAYRADQNDCAQRLIDTVNATGGLVSFENGTVAPLADPDWIDLGEVYLRACDEKGIEPMITGREGVDDASDVSSKYLTEDRPGSSTSPSMPDVDIHNRVVALCDSADDSGCSDDLIVVSRLALRELALHVLQETPEWLSRKD